MKNIKMKTLLLKTDTLEEINFWEEGSIITYKGESYIIQKIIGFSNIMGELEVQLEVDWVDNKVLKLEKMEGQLNEKIKRSF